MLASGALLRAIFVVGQSAGVWADGWYFGGKSQSCDTSCAAEGGSCIPATMAPMLKAINAVSILTLVADTGAAIPASATVVKASQQYASGTINQAPNYSPRTNELAWNDEFPPSQAAMADLGCGKRIGDKVQFFCYCSGITPAWARAGVGGDPITHFHGVEYKFSILNYVLTELLRTEDLVVRASCFPGDQADEQWIGWVVVESTDGELLADLKIRNMTEMDGFASDGLPRSSPETLELTLPWLQTSLISFPVNEEGLVDFLNHKIMPFYHPHQDVGIDLVKLRDYHETQPSAPRREGLLITGASLKMFISSSSAKEYYFNDIDDHRALKYAHLDIEFLDTKKTSSWTGLLPEIWGIKPRSDASNQALIEAKASTSAQAAPPTQASTSAQAASSTHPSARAAAAAEADSDRHQLNRQILLAMLSSEEGQDLSDSGVCGSDGCSHDSWKVTV